MNRKGSYTASVALVAVVLTIVVAIGASAGARAAGEENVAQAVAEVKREWNSARYLLDKSTADALADDFVTGDCIAVGTGSLSSYLDDTLTDSGLGCEITAGPTPDTSNSPDVDVTVTLKCSKKVGGFEIAYEKQALFEKTVTGADGCVAVVVDRQSGVQEVGP